VDASNYSQRVQKQVSPASCTNSSEVASLLVLQPGCYLVIPCTFHPGVEIKFLLRIFTDVDVSAEYEKLMRFTFFRIKGKGITLM